MLAGCTGRAERRTAIGSAHILIHSALFEEISLVWQGFGFFFASRFLLLGGLLFFRVSFAVKIFFGWVGVYISL